MSKKKHTLSEEELITALRNKEKAGIEYLYDNYSAAVYGIIKRIVQTEEVAEDVMQEAFVKIWNSFESFDESKGRLFTWIINVSRNLAIDKVRSKEHKNTSKNQDIENNVVAVDSIKNSSNNPELIGLKELVKKLKPEQQSIIDLIYFQGYTHVEAAEKLDIPLGTIKTRLRTGIITLRKYFN